MKKLIPICLALALTGCVNTLLTRNPYSNEKVQRVYQSTTMAAAGSFIIMFPQMMSDAPSMHGFDPLNILTVPIGLLCFCDVPLELAVDTVCLPFDWPISRYRDRK